MSGSFGTNLHRTTLYTEYCLCKQLLRVCGAVPDREASEEELTESEEEEESVLEEDKVISHILHTVVLPITAADFQVLNMFFLVIYDSL